MPRWEMECRKPEQATLLCDVRIALPRVYHRNAEVFEMANIARRERRAACQRNAGDLGVAHVHRSTGRLPFGGQPRGFDRGCAIEIQHPILEVLAEQLVERRFQRMTAATRRQ